MNGNLSDCAWPRSREAAGRFNSAREYIGDSRGAFIPRVPDNQNCGTLFQNFWNGKRTTGKQNCHHGLSQFADAFQQSFLSAGKVECLTAMSFT
jgi:hypothetical protein